MAFYIESGTGRQLTDTKQFDPTKSYVESGTGRMLTSADLTDQTPINLPTAPVDQNNYAGMLAGGNTEFDSQYKLFQDYLSSLTPPPSSADAYNKAYEASGVTQAQNALNTEAAAFKASQAELGSIQAQLQGLATESQAVPIQIQQDFMGRGATKAGVAPIEASRQREIALRALPLQAQGAIALAKVQAQQGNVELAQQTVLNAQNKLNTVFQLQQQDLQRQYDYQREVRGKVFEFLTTQEKNRLAAIQREDDRAFELKKLDIAQQQRIELANLENSFRTATTPAPVGDNGQPLLTPQAQTQLATDKSKVDLISNLTTDKYLGTAVGTNPLARISFSNLITGGKSNFIAGVEQIRSQLNLDALIQAKAQGATFGALSDQELRILASSASKLGTWAIKNKEGEVTGYRASESDFRKELDRINNFARMDYILKGGNPEDVGARTLPDGTIWVQNSDGTFTQLL